MTNETQDNGITKPLLTGMQIELLRGSMNSKVILLTGGTTGERIGLTQVMLGLSDNFHACDNGGASTGAKHGITKAHLSQYDNLIIGDDTSEPYTDILKMDYLRIKMFKKVGRPIELHFIPITGVCTPVEGGMVEVSLSDESTCAMILGYDETKHSIELEVAGGDYEKFKISHVSSLAEVERVHMGTRSYLALSNKGKFDKAGLKPMVLMIDYDKIGHHTEIANLLSRTLRAGRALGMYYVVYTSSPSTVFPDSLVDLFDEVMELK